MSVLLTSQGNPPVQYRQSVIDSSGGSQTLQWAPSLDMVGGASSLPGPTLLIVTRQISDTLDCDVDNVSDGVRVDGVSTDASRRHCASNESDRNRSEC
eukprot:1196303-Prorocentrum_minimum.AAC.3